MLVADHVLKSDRIARHLHECGTWARSRAGGARAIHGSFPRGCTCAATDDAGDDGESRRDEHALVQIQHVVAAERLSDDPKMTALGTRARARSLTRVRG